MEFGVKFEAHCAFIAGWDDLGNNRRLNWRKISSLGQEPLQRNLKAINSQGLQENEAQLGKDKESSVMP